MSNRVRKRKNNAHEHWLDCSEEKFGKQLVNDTKVLLGILVLYIPAPIVWGLMDLQSSRWTIQATRMTGDLGFYEIKPDQIQIFSPLLILISIPLFDNIIYPLLAKIGIKTPLQKIAVGAFLSGLSLLISGTVELQLAKTYPVLPIEGESQLRIFNSMPCDYAVTTNIPDHNLFIIKSIGRFEDRQIKITTEGSAQFLYSFNAIENTTMCPPFDGFFSLSSAKANSYQIRQSGVLTFEDDPNKSRTGDPLVRVLANTAEVKSIQIVDLKRNRFERFSSSTSDISVFQTVPSTFEIVMEDVIIGQFSTYQGGVYTLLISEGLNSEYLVSLQEISAPNSVNMLWLAPQYTIQALGETVFAITGYSFAYAEAPKSMKAVVQAFWLMTIAVGNLIDIFVIAAKFPTQAMEFFVFAGLLFVDLLLFMYLSYRYKRPAELAVEEGPLIAEQQLEKIVKFNE